MSSQILRYAAFTTTPTGGNPAGVVLDAIGLDDEAMLGIAAELGYSETAFFFPHSEHRETPGYFTVRYFSPKREVPFCGHATIASAVAFAERYGPGRLHLHTRGGLVLVDTATLSEGPPVATLTSVRTRLKNIETRDLDQALKFLRWTPADLDPAFPPRIGFAGVHHLILACRTRERLSRLNYDFDRLLELMLRLDLTTLQLVWRERPDVYHARDPFPVGGIVEDPATGAAAAALGGYLRDLKLVTVPARFTILQGHDIGRPSTLTVEVPDDGGVRVSGHAVPIPA
ncbi:MAG: PhzF family phenazine biosynthesis isomerase [Gemmatimonadota bacterium]